ncbi:DUF2336 domain-containing protein [Rhodoplanes sp.]|uniref:DUF2336 domain-containing protein n=1 Tax=Rhodoplanes sp. TaxID=1968906 RepID=UPI00260116A0|nr:DUF2336 domain-containing protein [Rhodoplanes sp.]
MDELDETLASGSTPSRTRLLRRVTDLYLDGAIHYSDEQISLFDDVLGRLLSDIEESAKRELARRLAAAPMPPPKVARTLALDETPAVAAPLLIHNANLDDADLLACARKGSQVHLLAITKRPVVNEPVTDVLVVRGSDMVVRSVADNSGSRFSDAGFGALVRRADGDDVLAARVGRRPDLPRHHFVRLLAKASEAVREQLQAGRKETAEDIRSVVSRVADAIATRTAADSKDYAAATADVDALHQAGSLGEAEIRGYAGSGRFEHTTAALARLADLPLPTVERLLLQQRPESLLFLAKALGFGWPTTRIILLMRLRQDGSSDQGLDLARSSFDRIKRATAEQVLDFQRTRRDHA